MLVEDGTGLPNSTSFASVAEFDGYCGARVNAAVQLAATTDAKEKALQTSTLLINSSIEWTGRKKKADQALGWPREYAIESGTPVVAWPGYWPTTSYTYYDDDSVPKGVKDATCELARELLIADRTAAPQGQGIKSVGLGQGAVEVEFDATDRAGLFTEMVTLLLRPFGTLIVGGGTRQIAIRRA